MPDTGPQNMIPDEFGTELPHTQVEEAQLVNEKNMARFSKSKEFKALKEYMEGRIEFFQKYLPDGRPLTSDNVIDEKDWIIANTVIAEFQRVLDAYENAAEVVKNATKNN